MKQSALIFLLLVSLGAKSQNGLDANNSAVQTSRIEKNNVPDSLKLFVFVGEKIFFKSRRRFPSWAFSRKYVAKYKVIECIYGNCEEEKVRFKIYSHLDLRTYPEYALLFVHRHRSRYYLEYRQMISLQKTIDGRWANCGPWNRGEGSDGKQIEPVVLKFEEDEWRDISGIEKELIPNYYPEPYYEIVGDSARCIMGFYVEDLFKIRKYGVLKARGVF